MNPMPCVMVCGISLSRTSRTTTAVYGWQATHLYQPVQRLPTIPTSGDLLPLSAQSISNRGIQLLGTMMGNFHTLAYRRLMSTKVLVILPWLHCVVMCLMRKVCGNLHLDTLGDKPHRCC